MTAIPTDQLRQIAAQAGFEFTTSELDAIRPVLVRALESLQRLERLPVAGIEPAVQYRIGA